MTATARMKKLGIDKLDFKERLELIRAIWKSIANEGDDFTLTRAQKKEIDRRWARHKAHPEEAIPWEKVKADALARLRRHSSN